IRFVTQAIVVEATRQIEIWENGGSVDQETRLFDPARGETRSLRSKEDAHDYRYFPDPDLLPLVLEQSWVDGLAANLPELPDEKRARFQKDYGITAYDAGVLVAEQATADFYESVARGRDGRAAVAWLTGDFFAALNRLSRSVEDSPVSAAALGEMLDLIADGTINGKIAKEVLETMFETGESASEVIERKGLKQVTDTGAIEAAADDIIARHADKVAEYKSGKDKLFGFFVGQVMKATGGKANPAMVNELLKGKLDS
ncbi:MAG: Asp-tRNA(Asn)/Glu-tRNA(Gln) amidotransferase GatCAB subunit B, partial [Acetobacter sp.]|nr:Asp-tRNA(Asn)/Glu-tRNA(Gln) amidotransferase GatCAB subunit B [Acetobacter sp.]